DRCLDEREAPRPLDRRATLAEPSRAAAVLHILQLHENPVGIREVQLPRSFLRTASILHPHADVVPHPTDGAGLALARLDAVALERFQDRVRIEVLEIHAEVIDARARRGAAAAATAAREHQELDRRTDGERWRGRSLIRADAEAEEVAIERVR